MTSAQHPPPIPAPAEYGITRSTEVPLYWCRYGPTGRQPLLVLHGGPGAHHDYLLPQMLALAEGEGGHGLLFYDQRGGGRSKSSDRAAITWETHVRDLAAIITEFRLDRPVLVGYSWGGLLAMLYASEVTRDPELPAPGALALIDPAPNSRKHR